MFSINNWTPLGNGQVTLSKSTIVTPVIKSHLNKGLFFLWNFIVQEFEMAKNTFGLIRMGYPVKQDSLVSRL